MNAVTKRSVMVLSIADLRHVAVACQACHTRVVIDLAAAQTAQSAAAGAVAPAQCPTCGAAFDSALKRLIKWHEVYTGLKDVAGVQIEVHLPEE